MSLLMAALDVADDLSPALWAALFAGVMALLIIGTKRDDDREDQ